MALLRKGEYSLIHVCSKTIELEVGQILQWNTCRNSCLQSFYITVKFQFWFHIRIRFWVRVDDDHFIGWGEWGGGA